MDGTDVRERTIIFLHNPRTGGTTLSTTVERLFPPRAVFPGTLSVRLTPRTFRVLWGRLKTPQQVVHTLTKLSEEDKRELKYLHGHLRFGIHAMLPQPCVYVTILRHPVDRILSLYHFLRRRPDMNWYDQVRTMGVRDFVAQTDACRCNNGQVRRLSGVGGDVPLTGDTLELAKRNLREHFMLVGITERFNAMLLLLAGELGLSWQDVLYSRRNVGKYDHTQAEISDDVVALIRQRNDLDLALYQFAQQMFAQSVHEKGPPFQRKLRAFEVHLSRFQALPHVRVIDWARDLAIDLHVQVQFGIRRLGSLWAS